MRRFRRRRFTRRRAPVRRLKRIVRRSRIRLRKKSRRRQRAKSYFYGYSQSTHAHSPANTITITNLDNTTANTNGLFAWRDSQEIFEQVKNIEDFVYPGVSVSGKKAGRQLLTIRARGEQLYQVSNVNTAGSAWVEVYICRPRKYIPTGGIGSGPNVLARDVVANNLNNAFLPDYNDARGITISAAGTGGVTNILQNATSQVKPTITSADYVVTPYMVPPFTEHWKVIKHLKYNVPAGGQFMFKVKTPWIRMNRQTYGPVGTGDGTTITDWTCFRPWFGREVFIRLHGQPVKEPGSEIIVNYGSVGLACVSLKKYWYSHSARPLPSYFKDVNSGQGTVTVAQLPSGTTEGVEDP